MKRGNGLTPPGTRQWTIPEEAHGAEQLLGARVVLVEIDADGAMECEPLLGEAMEPKDVLPKEPPELLDGIEPPGSGGEPDTLDTGTLGQGSLDALMVMDGPVVLDDVDVRCLGIRLVQFAVELYQSVTADDGAVDVEDPAGVGIEQGADTMLGLLAGWVGAGS